VKILLINSSDKAGGAAGVGWLLAKGLRRRHHEVDLLVGRKFTDSPYVRELPKQAASNARSWSQRIIHRLGINTLGFDCRVPKILKKGEFRCYDVIHIHDLPPFNWLHLPWLSRQAPLVWTMHSMQPFTGNCIYSYGCERFRKNCGSCPQFGQWPLNWLHRDGSFLNMFFKRNISKRMTIHIIGVSDWISEQARKSFFGRFPVVTIKNAADPDHFFPVNRAEARARLQIPHDARAVMLSVATNILDKRKGFDIALDALPKLADLNLFLLPTGIAGDVTALTKATAGIAGLKPRHITDDVLLRDYYASADLVWHPSRADTSSLVIIEANACGTPVIAARVGGVPEVVCENSDTLIAPNDSDALAKATRMFFQKQPVESGCEERRPAGDASRQFARFIDEHETLYEKMIRNGTTHTN
jgi:glycosyltransferase involved in cell wall biosynthesis